MNYSTDVLIVGGGPAGLSAAIALRQRRIPCVVVEALSPAIDKACGEGLMPDALTSLSRLGVEIREHDGYPLRGIRFSNPVHHVDAKFPAGVGVGIRRTRLHSCLAEHAREAGAQLLWNTRLKLMSQNSALVNGKELKFNWLIGADGQASRVRRWAGLDSRRKESVRYGFRRHYQVKPWSDFVEVHWGASGQVYVTPIASDCLCVVYITRDLSSNRRDFLEDFPELKSKLYGTSLISQQRGAVSATRKLHRVTIGSVALIGDASGSADAITGEGLAMTFRQALALAEAVEKGSLDFYDRAHGKISRLPHAMGALMLTMDRWPRFEVRAMRTLDSNPALFHDLLAIHVGVKSLLGFTLRRGPQLGWNLIFGA